MGTCGSRQWIAVAAILAAATCTAPLARAQILPALPLTFVDTSYPPRTGLNIPVPAGGDLQLAINAALPGDTILLDPGATYVGPFTLPVKTGSGWIVIRTSAPDSSLPPAGTRITPAYSALLPKIVTQNTVAAVLTDAGAHHFRFTAVEFSLGSAVTFSYALAQLGDGSSLQSSLSQVPHDLILDRVYMHGRSDAGLRRAVALNCGSAAIIDSYISEVHEAAADSQAIGGWNGPGPYKITDNYLEASGENILFGGADPAIANLVPSDIEVRGNHFDKQVAWRVVPAPWVVKNILELKNARRVLVDGNIFEHNWPAAQNGFSILFTVRNQSGTAPWSVVEDVTFTNNIVRHVAAAVNILGTDNLFPSQQTKRILIKNNLFDDVNSTNWGGSGRLFQLLAGTADVTIDHNTAFHTGEVVAATAPAHARFFYRNNLTPNNQYGVGGDGTYGNPNLTLATYFPGAVFARNALVGGTASSYPADNFFPPTMTDVQFVNLAGGNYRLQVTSPLHNAGTDGYDVGVDFNSLEAATAAPIDAPLMLSATAMSTSQVALSWQPVSGATTYEIYRAPVIGTLTYALTTSATTAVDSGRTANTTYLYKVRAIGAGGPSALSAVDAATTIVFTDASLTGTRIKAIHLLELRIAVAAMRVAALQPVTTFTDTVLPGTLIKRVHVSELRTFLDGARSTIGLPAIVYTDPTLSSGVTPVKPAHIQDLRNATQ